MDGQSVSLKQIVDLVMLWAEEPDNYLYGGSRALVLSHAKRLLQELNYAGLRSVRIHEAEIGASRKVTVPKDFVEYVRVYYCVGNYLMPAFENKHINTLQYESLKDVEEQLILTLTGKRILTPSGDYLTARVKLNESVPATGHPENWCFLEGYKYDHKNNCFVLDYVPDGVSHVAIEYVADPLISEPDPAKLCIHKYFEKAMESGIYYRIIETRHNVPMHEKVRAKKEWNIKYKDAVKELNAKPQELIQAIMGWKHMRSDQGAYAGMGGQRIPEPKPKEILYMASFIEYVCQTLTKVPEKVRNRLTVSSVATKQKITMTVTAEKEVHTAVEVSYSILSRAAAQQGKVTIPAGRKTANVDVAADFYGQELQFSIYSVDGVAGADSDMKYSYEIESPVTLEELTPKPVNHIRAAVVVDPSADRNKRIRITYTCAYPTASVVQVQCSTNQPVPLPNYSSIDNLYRNKTTTSFLVDDTFGGQTCLLNIESVDGIKGALEDGEYIYAVDATLVFGNISPLTCLQDFVPQGNEAVGAEVRLIDKRDGIVYRCVKMADGNWWMGQNMQYASASGSSVYENNPANLAVYGRLYDWQTSLADAPENWHLPSDEEWKQLEMALGMTQEEADKLYYFRGTDQGTQLKQGGSSGLNLPLGGLYLGFFTSLDEEGNYWSSTTYGSSNALLRVLLSNKATVHRHANQKSHRYSVRYVLGRTTAFYMQDFVPTGKESVGTEIVLVDKRDETPYRCVKMADGNWWMAENFRGQFGTYMEGQPTETYGLLYQWDTVAANAPEGWHLPVNAEWQDLANALGGNSVAGGKMKQEGTSLWNTPNTAATNESRWNGLPGGIYNNGYNSSGRFGFWWSAENYNEWNMTCDDARLYGPNVWGSNDRLGVRYILNT